MPWIALAVVCTALVFITYYSPKIGFSLLAAIGILLSLLYLINDEQSDNAEFAVSRDSVTLTETDATNSYGDSWDYSGRITNSSEESVTDVQIRIQIHDCPQDATKITEDCVIIGDDVDFVTVNVPSRQARDFRDTVSFRNAIPKGTALWKFELVGVRISD